MNESSSPLAQLLEVMRRLRDPHNGCPWDREQSFATIAPYTIEEAYEVADAIERGDAADLRSELGDLLFQIVFHARMAEEKGWFDFDAVAEAIRAKLVRRHPHVFAAAVFESAHAQNANWEEQKAGERAQAAQRRGQRDASVLDDVPQALPALLRAAKLGKRAARVGFDWPDHRGVRAKLDEELAELDAQIASRRGAADEKRRPAPVDDEQRASERATNPTQLSANESAQDAIAEELGDALFTLVNLGRHLQVDSEEALRAANRKFENRFRQMEALARQRGLELDRLSAEQWDALWNESKQRS